MAGYVPAVSCYDNQPHIRVYKSDGTRVTEQSYDGSWQVGNFSANDTTVGATSWLDVSGQIHIRVYVGSGGRKAGRNGRGQSKNRNGKLACLPFS